MKQRGFTVIEMLVVFVLLCVGAWLFFSEKSTVDSVQRDAARKVAVNAMYYNLEEVYYPAHKYYPQNIDGKVLRAMDPSLFADPDGVALGEHLSDYRYSPTGCTIDGHCKGYTLVSTMEREGDFTKTSRSHTNN